MAHNMLSKIKSTVALAGGRAFFVPAGSTQDKGNTMTDVIPISDENATVDSKWLKDQCDAASTLALKVDVLLTMLICASDTSRKPPDSAEIISFCQMIKDANEETGDLIEQIQSRTFVFGGVS